MAKTSLEKSHSKASNAELTFVCFLLALFVGTFFAGLGLVTNKIVSEGVALATLIVGIAGTICMLTAIMLFKR